MNPKVGMGVTINYYTDRRAATIVDVSPGGGHFWLVEDKQQLLNHPSSGEPDALQCSPGGFAAHISGKQRWHTEPDPDGVKRKVTLRKNGKWGLVGETTMVILGVRSPHYDYNF